MPPVPASRRSAPHLTKKASAKKKGSDETTSSLVESLTKFLGLIAAALALVYIAGAAVVWARLENAGLPTDAIVASLPRELLVTIGLRTIVFPGLLFALVAGWFLVVRIANDPTGPWWSVGPKYGLIGVVSALLVGSPLALYTNRVLSLSWAVAIFIVAYAAIGLTQFLGKKLTSWGSWGLAMLMALIVGIFAAAVRIGLELDKTELEEARVCVTDGGVPYDGLLIGETSNSVFLVWESPKDETRVVEIPRDRLAELRIGTGAKVPCPASSPAPANAGPASISVLGDVQLGLFLVQRDGTLDGAIRSFGRPTSLRRGASQTCLARWGGIGLRIVFNNQAGRDPCVRQYGRFNNATLVGSNWVTAKGLRVGDPAQRLSLIYSADRTTGSWAWLVTRDVPNSDGIKYPGLAAKIHRGWVTAFRVRHQASDQRE